MAYAAAATHRHSIQVAKREPGAVLPKLVVVPRCAVAVITIRTARQTPEPPAINAVGAAGELIHQRQEARRVAPNSRPPEPCAPERSRRGEVRPWRYARPGPRSWPRRRAGSARRSPACRARRSRRSHSTGRLPVIWRSPGAGLLLGVERFPARVKVGDRRAVCLPSGVAGAVWTWPGHAQLPCAGGQPRHVFGLWPGRVGRARTVRGWRAQTRYLRTTSGAAGAASRAGRRRSKSTMLSLNAFVDAGMRQIPLRSQQGVDGGVDVAVGGAVDLSRRAREEG